jgi:hypothetical protein
VNGAELAGAWGTREAFVAVITTNLPMVFPLFRAWLKPFLGSSARSSAKQYKTPEGFRSIGGGGGGGGEDSRSHGVRVTRTPGSKGANPLTNVSFTESEERIINDIKLQNMKAASTMLQGSQQGNKAIFVRTEFDISEDSSSQHHDKGPARVHESW